MGSVDCIRMTAVENRTRTLQQQQQQQQQQQKQEHSLPGRSLRFSSTHISHRSRFFARIFQNSYQVGRYFRFNTKKYYLGFRMLFQT